MNSNIMKKALLIIPLALLLLVSCRKTNNPTVFALRLDMQENFSGDNVRVYIDNQPLLNKKVTSDTVLGFGGSVSTANTEGSHTIKVIVNDNIVTSENFTQNSDLYIGVGYNKTAKRVSISYSTDVFGYN